MCFCTLPEQLLHTLSEKSRMGMKKYDKKYENRYEISM